MKTTPVYRVLTLFLVCLLQTVASMAADETGNGQKDLFITTRISDNTPFAGEAVELTYTLFFKGIAPKILDTAKPSHEGIWAEEAAPQMLMPSKPEQIGNTLYRSAVIKKMTLVPLQPGRLGITGYKVLCITQKNISSHADPEHSDSLKITAPSITMDVVPFPEPKPPGFRGVVGKFSAAASAERDTVLEGSSVRLTTTVTGKGSLFSFPDRGISLPEGFRRIDESTSHIPDKKTAPLSGNLKKTITLKAEAEGTFTFSPLSFTVFDPERRIYSTVTADSLTLTVLPMAVNVVSEGYRDIENSPSESVEDNKTNSLYRLLLALPVALIAVLLYLLLKKRSSHNPAPEQKHSPEELQKQVYRAIKLSYGLEAEKIPKSELRDRLKKQGVDTHDLKKLFTALDEFDRLKYSPGEPDKEELERLRKKCKTLNAILRSRPSR